jgi:hypothetical protein
MGVGHIDMLEWNVIESEKFINPKKEVTQVKLLYPFRVSPNVYEVETRKRDLDLIASEEMGTEMESLNVLQNNASLLMDYNFEIEKIPVMRIPVQ